MATATGKDWVVPANIPFANLKKKDLEECVFWLLDGMGAKDLAWRKGGTGDGASDGGRDLEAKFYVSNDKGEVEPQLWWVECKGRSGTVEADEVKVAVNNALATKDLVWIVIATNTQFSNPTRDWVQRWQEKHPSPKVALWDHVTLEKYLSEHPQVVLRLFAQALSRDGKLQAMEQRFWSKLEYVAPDLLEELWQQRHDGTMEGMAMFAAICNEFAHGDITQRPWAGAIDVDLVARILENGLQNMSYLSIRAHAAGVDMHPIVRTITYLILIVLDRLPAKACTKLIEEAIYRGKKDEMPDYAREVLILPITVQLLTEMMDLCVSDCRRVYGVPRQALREDRDERENYWQRFESDRIKAGEKRDRFVLIENHKEPCKVGYKLSEKRSCPLVHLKPTIDNFGDLLKVVKKVAAFRKKQAALKRAADAVEAMVRAKPMGEKERAKLLAELDALKL
jgi:hypothetical protein